jgi:hypothetical protein
MLLSRRMLLVVYPLGAVLFELPQNVSDPRLQHLAVYHMTRCATHRSGGLRPLVHLRQSPQDGFAALREPIDLASITIDGLSRTINPSYALTSIRAQSHQGFQAARLPP